MQAPLPVAARAMLLPAKTQSLAWAGCGTLGYLYRTASESNVTFALSNSTYQQDVDAHSREQQKLNCAGKLTLPTPARAYAAHGKHKARWLSACKINE
jgi:hypothetical protein